MVMKYNDPYNGTESTVGTQMNTYYWDRNSLIEMQKSQYFTQLSSTTKMPKHFGKNIKKYVWIPLLDDRNINDQGIDATGAVVANGNMWGSSKDVGTIVGKLPAVGETGGRVNRVGYTRVEIEATMTRMGFFDEFTKDSIDFDSEENVRLHYRREAMYGANEISEACLQIDLLNAAGLVRFGGVATADGQMTGEGDDVSEVDYNDFMRLAIDLRDNRTPVQTKVITGSRLIDTKVISEGFPLYVGSEMLPTLRHMVDPFGDAAFIPRAHYEASGQTLRGEVGTIDQFRIIVVPEMLHWAGVGATETAANKGYRATSSKYDVFPLLAVGNEAFTTIGFQSDGKSEKYSIITKMPSREMADANHDPYGLKGFFSILWWYGTLIERPERIGLMKSVART